MTDRGAGTPCGGAGMADSGAGMIDRDAGMIDRDAGTPCRDANGLQNTLNPSPFENTPNFTTFWGKCFKIQSNIGIFSMAKNKQIYQLFLS